MVLALATVARSDHGMWIEIDPPYERNFALLPYIDKPALLMLAETWVGAVPPNPNPVPAGLKPVEVIPWSPKCIGFELFGLIVWPPADQTDIESARGRAPQHV
jgi:hypothetical protein